MQNISGTAIAICVAVALLLVAPLVSLADRNDNVVQENAKLIIEEFVTDIQNTGVLTKAKYQNLENSLAATGNTYDIEMEIQHLDMTVMEPRREMVPMITGVSILTLQ